MVKHQNRFFIGADNGVFSLLLEELPHEVYAIDPSFYKDSELFPEKNVFIPFIASYLKQGNFNGIALPASVQTAKKSLTPIVEPDGKIIGTILMVDNYQNGITNISKELFEEKRAGRDFKVFYIKRHFIDKISEHYHDCLEGDDLLLFNEKGLMEIAMNKGKGAQLLGLRKGSNVIVEFY